ncbi:bacillithiol biosynthesis cysteine-adding enzyme BshC [Paenibacillus phyllosphaerae]|uniref:Putative cysteine ligase BshC n=1 Tax=Paenibacillus phyllosphaerae TaxID=274593 RepID=A0A7W5AV10_9BACL|nr:bacillithiol biosynthesis cysteine-adding enzyme BshC [Paenibacillus phyllosphaerae]MBB3109044.1 bacillithiol biosynthesis cysteine-adding enzyme BshC [Paenibacillus phyllosphaerae]
MTMGIETYPLPSSQSLTEAYIHQTDPKLAERIGKHSSRAADWQTRMAYLDASKEARVPASELSAVLSAYNERFNSHEAVKRGIELIQEGAPVIVGGQQAGLWTGPMLVIHKAVSVIQAAKEAAGHVGRPVVPVFWIAGEDHDWEEANHAYIVTEQVRLRKIAVKRDAGLRTSVSRTKLDLAVLQTAMDELAANLPDTPHKQELLSVLQGYMEQSATLSDWFAYVIGHLFGEYGLVMMDADDPSLRKLEGPMFRQMITHNDELRAAYARGAAAVSELGYPVQAEATEGCANIFLFQEEDGKLAGERTLLYKRKGKMENRKGTWSLDAEELLRMSDQSPERLSNNVLTRPIMQDYVLPVLGAVLGPGEIAYWALTVEGFAAMGMQMPLLVPRMSFTLVEPQIASLMTKFELTFDDTVHRLADKKQAWLDQQDELRIHEQFEEAKRQFAQLYEPLLAMASSVQPALAELGDKNRGRILDQIDYMAMRTREAHDKRYDAVTHQLDRIAIALRPNGQPQERVLNVVHYWNQYGTGWLKQLLDVPFDALGNHRLVYI